MTENITLFNNNCLDVLKEIKNIDLVITDPPYIMTSRGKSCRPNWMEYNKNNIFDSDLVSPFDWMPLVFNSLNDQTHFYVFSNTLSLLDNLTAAKNTGFKLQNIISMIKDTGMPNRWYYKQTELILFFRKGQAKPINDYTSRDNVKVTMPKNKTGKLHITQKPIDFLKKLITNSSKNNETVMDPFCGSGTTGIACLETNRKFIGIEIEKKYFEMAKNRITKHSHFANFFK